MILDLSPLVDGGVGGKNLNESAQTRQQQQQQQKLWYHHQTAFTTANNNAHGIIRSWPNFPEKDNCIDDSMQRNTSGNPECKVALIFMFIKVLFCRFIYFICPSVALKRIELQFRESICIDWFLLWSTSERLEVGITLYTEELEYKSRVAMKIRQ